MLSFYSPRRIAYSYLRSFFSKKPFNEILENKKTEIPHVINMNFIDLTLKKYLRNFILYRSLTSYLNVESIFILQPYIYWCGKKISVKERESIEYLDKVQKNSSYSKIKPILMESNTYKSYKSGLEKIAKKIKFRFYDANEGFNFDETSFVDSIHLNDFGNEKIANKIMNII